MNDDCSPQSTRLPSYFWFPYEYYGGDRCSTSSFANVRSSVMMPPAVNRGTAGSLSRSPEPEAEAAAVVVEEAAATDDGSCGASGRLFSTRARASQSTLASRPCLWYSQLISDSSEPRGISSARRTKPRERTYAFSLYSRLLMMPSSVPRSLSYAGSQNQLYTKHPRIESERRRLSMQVNWVYVYVRFFHQHETLDGNQGLK